jgi:hypothetical protein
MGQRFLLLGFILSGLAGSTACSGNASDDDDDVGGGGEGEGEGEGEEGEGEGEGNCIDADGDGAGVGDACESDDCDDSDPNTIAQCGESCDDNPLRAGCPCEAGAVVACYMGPDGTANNGVCAAGLKTCGADGWGGCDGQVLPTVSVETACNEIDDNCDGTVDEGVKSVCNDCNAECVEICVGVGCDAPFEADEGRSIIQNPDGSITLSGAAAVSNFVIWVANSQEGTVSKVNTRTREEEGRYGTMDPDLIGAGSFNGQMSPSRTTVNPHGDVVVSNREGSHGGSTKILASDCPDVNRNGQIETSTGRGDVLEWGEDECVAWYVDEIPFARGSAFEIRAELDGGIHEYVWIGSYNLGQNGTIFEVDSIEGEKTGQEIPTTGAYGLAMGPGGLLWSVGLGGCPVSTDTTSLEQTVYGCGPNGGAYGLAVDSEGRVWIGSGTSRLTPWEELWETPIGAQVSGGGITVDAFGNAYSGQFGGNQAYKIDGETMETTQLPNMGGHGWAVDFDGYIWSVDMNNSAHVMDPETFEVEHVSPPFVGPYTYSDMTGFQLQNTVTPAGVYERLFEVCAPEETLNLSQLDWEADVPAGAGISFRIKHASAIEELQNMGWIDVGSIPADPSPIDVAARLVAAGVDVDHLGHFVMVEATLQSIDRLNRPTLHSFMLRYSCSIIIQ